MSSNNSSSRISNLLEAETERLRDALTLHGTTIQVAPTEALRRTVAAKLLEALSHFLEKADTIKSNNNNNSSSSLPDNLIRDIFSTLFSELGPGDGQIRNVVLKLISTLHRPECRQVALDFLPAAATTNVGFDQQQQQQQQSEEITLQVMDTLHSLIARDPSALLPVLGCLSLLPLAESGRVESFQVALNALPMVAENELPTLVRTLLCHVASEEEAKLAWTALCKEWRLLEGSSSSPSSSSDPYWDELEDPMILVADIVLSSFHDVENGNLLVNSYLQRLRNMDVVTSRETTTKCLLLDLVVVLALSQMAEHSESVDRILYSFISSSSRFPFEFLLDNLLRIVCGGQQRRGGQPLSLLYQRLAPCLIRFSLFLLLAPARVTLSETALEHVQTFVLNLHAALDRERQTELVHSLLRLSEETAAFWDGGNKNPSLSRKRKLDGKNETTNNASVRSSQRLVHRSVNACLLSLAETSPTSLLRFKHILTGRLMSSSSSFYEGDSESIQSICRILARLIESDRTRAGLDCSEVMMLLQKLLFSTSGSFRHTHAGDTSKVERGLVLATECLCSSSLGSNDRDCIKEWVLRILLPTTRRMVDPEIGRPGLNFLKEWMSEDNTNSSKVVFQHFKILLSNTGLIQMLQHYIQNKKNGAVLAYTQLPSEFAPTVPKMSKAREMVFCIHFFLCRTDMHCPSRWRHTTIWVFELVDTYLRLGRSNASKGWNPNGWLRASLELPQFRLPPNSSNCLASIESELSRFDISDDLVNDNEAGFIESVSQVLFDLDINRVKDSIFRAATSLWVGIGLSAAVLQNSLSHYRALVSDTSGSEQKSGKEDLLKLLQFQLAKIYHMRRRLKSLEGLLRSVSAAFLGQIRRLKHKRPRRNRRKHSEGSNEDINSGALQQVEKAAAAVDDALIQFQDMDVEFLRSHEFIPVEALWACLVDKSEESVICRSLTAVASADCSPHEDWFVTGTRLIQVKRSLAEGLALLLAKPFQSRTQELLTSERLHFSHCLRLCYFLVDLLPVLRIGYFAKNREPTSEHLTMSSLLSFTASYLHLLTIMIIQSGHQESSSPTSGRVSFSLACMAGFKAIGALSRAKLSSSSTADDMFECFLTMLKASDSPQIVCMLMEILSVLAIKDGGAVLDKAIAASWSCLHTVYAHEKGGRSYDEPPYAILSAAKRACSIKDSGAAAGETLKRVFESTILRLSQKRPEKNRSFPQYGIRLLQHWGLISHSCSLILRYGHHLSSMVTELEEFVGSLDHGAENDEEKKESTNIDTSPQPRYPLPFLCASVFEDLFAYLLNMVVGVLAIMEPASPDPKFSSPLGPYTHFYLILRLFRRLLEVYQRHFFAFPARSSMDVYHAARMGLLSAVNQLYRCVDWRSNQPLLSWEEKEAGVYDPGAAIFLQALLSEMFSCTSASVLTLCDFWERSETSWLHSRTTRLHQASVKAAQSFQNVATTHNWAPPTEDSECTNGSGTVAFDNPAVSRNTESDCEARPRSEKRKARYTPDDESSDNDDALNSESEGSFGVAGDWGDFDDRSVESLQLN